MYWTSRDVLMISHWCTYDIHRCTHGIPDMHHGIPQCTEHPLMYLWYPPPPPMYSWCSPDVLNTPDVYTWYTPDVFMISLPMYSWYPPRCTEQPRFVLMISSWCTHGIPPMYWTHIIQCDKTIQHVSEPNLKLFGKKKQGYGPIKLEDFLLLCSY